MSLATTYDGKLRVINDILSKMSLDEKRIVLQSLIKEDMKTYFEVIWDEQKRLETEAGVEGVCEFTSDKAWADGEEIEQNDTGLEVNLAGKPSKEAENAYYLDEKIDKKQGNDRFDGFLGYVNSSGSDEIEAEIETDNDQTALDVEIKNEPENDQTESKTTSFSKENEVQFDNQTVLEPGEFIDKIADKIEELEMKTKMKNMKFPDFGGEK